MRTNLRCNTSRWLAVCALCLLSWQLWGQPLAPVPQLAPIAALAPIAEPAPAWAGRQRSGNDYSKNYNFNITDLSATETIELNNKFGMVNVVTWEKREFKADIVVKVWGLSESKAQELLSKINVNQTRGADRVMITTTLSGSINMRGESGFEINYQVYMPAKNPLMLNNSYGNVVLASIAGPLELLVKYGKLKAADILHENSRVRVLYGNGEINTMAGGSLTVSYGKCRLESTTNLNLTNNYSKIYVGRARNLSLVAKYGDMKIGEVGSITGTADYSGFNIGLLQRSMKLTAKYITDFQISYVAPGFDLIDLTSKFSSFTINFDPNSCFEFDARFRYGSLHYPKEMTKVYTMTQDDYGNSNFYTGRCGTSPSANSRLLVNAEYGDVRILRNAAGGR